MWKIIEHAVKAADRITHAVTEIRRCDNTISSSSRLKPRFTSDILFVCTSCLLTRLVRLHSIAVSFPDYCLYAIITVISPLLLPFPSLPPHPYLHVSSQLTLRFVALNIVSVYQKDRSTGNDMFPPGVKRHTCTHTFTQAAHTQAWETASSSRCNYGETEQSVIHLSAARIRAGVLLWHWWGKPGVSLLKQWQWQTATSADTAALADQIFGVRRKGQCRTWRRHSGALHARETTYIVEVCVDKNV